MSGLISKLTGLSNVEARRLLSTAGDIRISQIVNPKKTCRAVIGREALKQPLRGAELLYPPERMD